MASSTVLTGAAIFKEDKILLLKRLETKKILPNFWDIPGGKIEPFEDPNIGVLRELKEETDLEGNIIRPYNVWSTEIEFNGITEHVVEIDYLIDAGYIDDNTIKLSKSEHSRFAWFKKDELPKELSKELRATIIKAFDSIR